jgi:hypothetical protein
VNEGARLITFLDGPTAPELMIPALAPPFQLQQAVESADGDALTPGPRRLFADWEAGDFSAPRFHRHLQNQVLGNRAHDVVLAYPDGSAALTLSAAGRGAVALANLPLTPDGGDFIGHPLFPALLHDLLHALRQDAADPGATPGVAFVLDAPAGGEGSVTVADSAGGRVEAQVIASGRNTRLAMPAVKSPGAYPVMQAGAVIGYAIVNVDPRESDPRPLALENLKSATGSTVAILGDEADLSLAGKTRELWPDLALAAAVFLAGEMVLLAWWRNPGSAFKAAEARGGAAR